ncbi:hypothetical protein [Micromonospora echinofusca]|uniref:hypothetical protein n=1 Tax=Micromonospora echinofusca TaxID=47858 RepID=UPI0034D46100
MADRPRPGKPTEIPGSGRARVLALTRMTPPQFTWSTHWSSWEMAAYLARHENIPGVAQLHRRPVAYPRSAAAPVRHLQTVPRSGVHRQGRQRRRPVPEPTRRGGRALRR